MADEVQPTGLPQHWPLPATPQNFMLSLIDAYQGGVIELVELQERRQRSDEHTRFLRQRLDEIEQQRRDREQEVRPVQGLEVFCASIQDALVDPSFAVKQQILQLVIDRIVVEDTRIVIKHIIPVEP